MDKTVECAAGAPRLNQKKFLDSQDPQAVVENLTKGLKTKRSLCKQVYNYER